MALHRVAAKQQRVRGRTKEESTSLFVADPLIPLQSSTPRIELVYKLRSSHQMGLTRQRKK